MIYDDVHHRRVRELILSATTVSEAADLTPDKALHELGIDSLATINLMVGLAEPAGVNLEDFLDDIQTPQTVGDLCALSSLFENAPGRGCT